MKLSAVVNRLKANVLTSRLLAAVSLGKFVLVRLLTDTSYASEIASKLFGKTLSDNSSASDQIDTKHIGKGLSDTVGATDDINGEAVLGDDQEILFIKSLFDNGVLLDQPALNVDKVLGDAISSSDNGSLLSQNYVSSGDYFAEDYVGTKITF
jgi:hypothetical protein